MTSRFEVHEAGIRELQAAMETGGVTSLGLIEAYLARITAYDRSGPCLQAMIRLNPAAEAAAAARDAERRAGRHRGPLHGVPVILKDNYATSEMPVSAGSPALASLRPRADAFQVARLRQAGAVILGLANMDELAELTNGLSSLGGQTRNPYDPTRIPGGSSGGSAVAATASYAAVAFGTDTGSSLRIPAADNNLFTLRPTKGLSSMQGIIPYSRTHDTAGPMARCVADLAIALDTTVGADPADAATRILDGGALPSFVAALDAAALGAARLGLLCSGFDGEETAEVAVIVEAAVASMVEAGAAAVEVALPEGTDLAGAIVWDHELKLDLADYLAGIPDAPVRSLDEILARGLFHPSLEARLRQLAAMPGRTDPAYRRALEKQVEVRAAVTALLDRYRLDALIYPTIRQKPPLVGAPPRRSNARLAAVTGLPALAAPAGLTADGLPVGLEMVGRSLGDARLLSLAYAYEQIARPRRPPATTPALTPSGVSV